MFYQEGQTCLHIGHLVPLERSNTTILLGSSGIVRSSENPLKMIVQMLTHMHMVLFTWCCWHICKGEGVGVDVDVDQLGEARKAFWYSPDTRLALRVEYCFDPLCFGSSIQLCCVAL